MRKPKPLPPAPTAKPPRTANQSKGITKSNAAARDIRKYIETHLGVKLFAGNQADLNRIISKHFPSHR